MNAPLMRIILFLVLGGCATAAAPDVRRLIPELKLRDGRTLTNVTIVSFATTAVMAKWDGGRGTIQYQYFTDDWRSALEPMRPRPSAARAQPIPAAPPQEAVTARAAENSATPAEGELEKLIAQQAAEIAAFRTRLEAIEKRLRQ